MKHKVLHLVPRFGVASQTFVPTLLESLGSSCSATVVSIQPPLSGGDVVCLSGPWQRLINGVLRRWPVNKPGAWVERPYGVSKQVRELIDDHSIQLVHCHFGQAFYYWSRLGLKNKPVVVSFHGADVLSVPQLNPDYRRVLNKSLRQENVRAIVPSEYLKGELVRVFSMPSSAIDVVANTYSDSIFTGKVGGEACGKNFTVSCVGRFVACKGHRYLLEAFARFRRSHPDAKLLLVGTSEGTLDIEELIHHFDLRDATEVLLDIPHHEIAQVLGRSSVYVQASVPDPDTGQEESFGVAALEALVQGVPAVLSRSGGLAELIKDDLAPAVQGVPPGDVSAIDSALDRMYELAEPCDTSQSTAYYREQFSGDKAAARVVDVYERTIAARRP